MKLAEQIGNRLRGLREKIGISQRELAKRIDMPYQNISNYERGFRQPDYDTLILLANYYEVTTDYLLYGNTENILLTTNEPVVLEIEDIINKNIIIRLDGREITMDELEEMLSYLKARRIMKDSRK
jgi:transcriptional regulator with XRE-family HTH domain